MTTAAIWLGIVGLILIAAWRILKAGADGRDAKANKEALQDVVKANRPVGLSERELLQSKYRRD